MSTVVANIYIDQGVDFSMNLELESTGGTNFDVSGKEFFCQARKFYSSSLTPIVFSVEEIPGEPNNDLILSLPGTESIKFKPGKYHYDVLMRTDSNIIKVLSGILFLEPTYTIIPE